MSSDKDNILLADSVHLEFGNATILQSAFITARAGRITGVLGRNGSGKSCLFKCIMEVLRLRIYLSVSMMNLIQIMLTSEKE